MKIGINALFIRPGINGGTETYTRELVSHLGEMHTNDHFIVYGLDPQLASWCAPFSNFEYVQIAIRSSVPLRIVYEQTAFVRRVQRDGVDVLFCPGYVAPLAGNFPIVTTIHDMFAFVYPQYLSKARTIYWRIMLPLTMKRSNRIIAVSNNTAADICRFYPAYASKLRVIREAANELFRSANSKTQIAGDVPSSFLLGVSTLQPLKNLRNLLLGYAASRQEHGVEAHLILIGRDAMGTVASLAKELGIGRYVHLTGFVPFEDLLRYYRSAMAFVSASLYEGFGLPLLEAMTCGCPVLCSRTSIFQEIAGDAALFFDPLEPAEIGRSIAQIAFDARLREKLQLKGFENLARFSWKRAAEEVYEILCSVVLKKSGVPATESLATAKGRCL
jgi:glycosyltransferase involved in cell wall biosynthesis